MKTIDKNKKSMKKGPGNHSYNTRFRLRDNTYPYLSNDLILRILSFLPAQVLLDVMRYVCKEWYHIVKNPAFVARHIQISSPGILAQHHPNKDLLALYEETNSAAGFKITQYRLPSIIANNVCDSCNGLLLLLEQSNREVFHVVINLVTKVRVSLPLLYRSTYISRGSTLACTSDGRFKVVRVEGERLSKVSVLVCTVGNDSVWRHIDNDISKHEFSEDEKNVLILGMNISIAGFIYWFYHLSDFCFALDVDTETMYTIPIPKNFDGIQMSGLDFDVVDMETTLGLGNYHNGAMKIWKLTDIKAGEWSMAFHIDLAPLCSALDPKFHYDRLSCMPLPCLRNGELWLRFYSSVDKTYALVFYNARNRKMFSCASDNYFTSRSHVNSLLLLDNHKLQLQ